MINLSKEQWLSCVRTQNGTLSIQALFIQLFGRKNSFLQIGNDDTNINFSKIDETVLKEIFGEFDYMWQTDYISKTKTSREDDFVEEEYSFREDDFNRNSDFILISQEKKRIYYVGSDYLSCFYCDDDRDKLKDELVSIFTKLPVKEEKPKSSEVNLVCSYQGGDYYLTTSKIRNIDINIDEHYNDDFKPVYEAIQKFLDQRESGLIILYGTPGTGKTTFIRHLCATHPKKYIVIPNTMASRLSDPDFISFMVENRDSIFILEDCEQLLMDRSENVFNGAISNILNMSDGLLSDIMNIKFICTFNADIQKIDDALLRPGRCFAKYEFKELSEDKVENLNNKYNLNLAEIKAMTLAEIYNQDSKEVIQEVKKKKIGF